MYGVVLEGGGLKGGYHLGAVKAIMEQGYEIGGYVGTSRGSFNAAVLVQGDFDKLYDTWYNASSTMGLDVDERELNRLVDKKWNFNTIKYWASYVKDNIANKGIDSSKLKAIYDSYIDE